MIMLELYNDLLGFYFEEYNELSDDERKKIEHKYDPSNWFLETYNYNPWLKKEESNDKEESADLSDIPLSESDEE